MGKFVDKPTMEDCTYHWGKSVIPDYENTAADAYCDKCGKLFSSVKEWSGNLTIGKMSTDISQTNISLSLTDVIADALGVSEISLTEVLVAPSEWSVYTNLNIGFRVGAGKLMTASITNLVNRDIYTESNDVRFYDPEKSEE